ncbi:50S ribosomal protein L18 [Alteracholeplasma palmae J233]|uniref:Large ribosomal subunit protein uL18 n=1 Tax=Alteracholeplasma palmae (strain ATCC 49389 / J233) TaxID=1318466 RepID=U4KSD0_ALTPJ|nr:50S ribosomal protein L18 [Alteracholeplasma palmae]CCV64911.1 50S ribosomal protein L18 [Alteracholeplasma palmae J233]
MITKQSSNVNRQKRHLRIRKTVIGTNERPRLSVYRSNTALYVQLVDDEKQVTLVSARSQETNVKGSNIEAATALGQLIAKKALDNGINTIVFDRSGYLYHGRIKALAEAAREAGLQF